MSELKPTCCWSVWDGLQNYTCGKTAKFDRDGKHYCGTHDPVKRAEKNAIKNATWKAEREAINAARDAAQAKQAELERRAGCYPELLEALKGLMASFNGEIQSIDAYQKAKAAIAKSQGEQT